MGWWPFGGGGAKPSPDIKAGKLPVQSGAEAAQAAADAKQLEELLKQAPANDEGVLAGAGLAPRPTSIFEFGEPVPAGGDLLRGMCAGADPDAIHACTWTIEPAQGRGRGKKPRYRVEF